MTSESVEPRTLAREFVFPGTLGAMNAARDCIMDFIHEQKIAEQDETDILIALQEALANAVLHGARNHPEKLIRCSVEFNPSAITITVKDPGEGFDTSASTTTDVAINLTEHGRGMHLMRSLVDEVTYADHGSEVRLKKLLAR
ncbi:MAG TPA: ATP-binding protein [Terriglobales bacterium]|nr:ATP-binding protein [Terriglobales bacterium]